MSLLGYTRVAVVTTLALAALTLTVTALALTIIFAPATFGALGTLSAAIILIPTMVTGGLTLASFATTTLLALYDKKNNKRPQAKRPIDAKIAAQAAEAGRQRAIRKAKIAAEAAQPEIVTDAAQPEIVTDAAQPEIVTDAAQYEPITTDVEDFFNEIRALPNNEKITFGQIKLKLNEANIPEENMAVQMCRDAASNAYTELEQLKGSIENENLSQFEAFMEHFKRFNRQDLTFEGVEKLIGPTNIHGLQRPEYKDTLNVKHNNLPENSCDRQIDSIYEKFKEEVEKAKVENEGKTLLNETFKPAALIMHKYFLKIKEDLMNMRKYYQSIKDSKKTSIGAFLRRKADPQQIIIDSFSNLIQQVENLGEKHFAGRFKEYEKTTLKTVDDAITKLESNIKREEKNSEINSSLDRDLVKIRNVIVMVFRGR